MPPKNKPSEAEEEVHRLQAVVLADSFKKRFAPVSYERPKALCPLVTIPILDYVLENLALSGVKHVFLFVRSHVSKFEQYLNSRKWKQRLDVDLVIAAQANSVGDALREIDSRHLVRGDFILINADVITNVNLSLVMDAHKKRRETNKNAIMTCVMKIAPPQHRLRTSENDIFVAMDANSQQLLHYEITSNEAPTFSLDMETFAEHDSVNVRYDLIDSHVAICSQEVIMAFADNFDWQDIETDFIKGILTSEILGQSIFVHVINREYAAQVKCLASYDAVSKDVIRRWTYPLVPDFNVLSDTAYEYRRPGIYLDRKLHLAQACVVSEDCVIGSNTTIEDGSVVNRTVIGKNCSIGSNVRLNGSYVWDNVRIGSGAKIDRAIICDGVVIGDNAVIERGAVLSFNVVVSDGHTVPAYTRLTCIVTEQEEEEDDWGEDENSEQKDSSAFESDHKVVGSNGVGRMWVANEDEDGDCNNSIAYERTLDVDEESSCSESDDDDDDDEDEEDCFTREVTDTVRRGVSEDHAVDNIVLEINSLKLAHDKSFGECGACVLPALLSTLSAAATNKEMVASINKCLSKWKSLLSKYIKPNVTYDQVAVISTLENFCWTNDHFKAIFHGILHMLYQLEILAEEGILEWAEQASERGDDVGKFFVAQSEKLLAWLKESDDEDDD